MTRRLEMSERIMGEVTRAVGLIARDAEPSVLFRDVLESLLQLTDSRYGWIGEVLEDDDGGLYMQCLAFHDTDWSPITTESYQLLVVEGAPITDLDNFFGWGVQHGGRLVISNDTFTDPRGRGTATTDPDLRTFLGIPVRRGTELVGQIGLVNRAEGYDEQIAAELEPFAVAIGSVIDAYRTHRRDRERTQELAALVSGLRDAVLFLDHRQRVVFINQQFCDLFEFEVPPEEMVGNVTAFDRWLLEPQGRPPLVPTGPRDRPKPLTVVADPEGFAEGIDRAYRQGVPATGVRVELVDGRVLERDYLPVERGHGRTGHLWLYRDVTESVRWEEDRAVLLEQEREQVRSLRELDQLKTEFVAAISHELRTPLTSILTFAELLHDDAAHIPDEQREFVKTILRNASRLSDLVDDLLLVARLESGAVEMHVEPTSFSRLVCDVATAFCADAEVHGVSMALELDDDPAPAVVDPKRMETAIRNLVSNALKFTPAGGTVTVRTHRGPDAWVLQVADTGIGIPPDEIPHLVDRFFRASTARQTSVPGSGLGLAIVGGIVERHAGTLAIDSGPEGTLVTVSLPDRPAEDPAR